jgi:hypothetical protein
MKKIILFFLNIFLATAAVCQSNPIEYQGGIKEFRRLLQKHIWVTDEMEKKDTNRNFNVFMNINAKGIVDRIEITSLGDSTGANMIFGVIKLSQLKWINHAGKDQVIVFQIYFIHSDELTHNIPEINTQYYSNWESKPVIRFEPVTVEIYPTVR